MARNRNAIPVFNSRGMALLLVVSVIALLSVVILRFNRSMLNALEVSSHYQNGVQLEAMAQSGIDIGAAVLVSDARSSEVDSLLENWWLLKDTPLQPGLEQGEVTVSITDLDGRFPLHSLISLVQEGKNPGGTADGMTPENARDILVRLLLSELFAVEDEAEASEIVDSLIDWIDEDDDESDNGAERSYYESLETPISIRNGLVDNVDELLQVKGVTADLLYGNDEMLPLADFVSVVNRSGRINVNTAPAALIQALDDRIGDEDTAAIEEYRNDENNGDLLGQSTWLIALLPGDIEGIQLETMTKTTSNHFEVRSEASNRDRTMVASAIISRESDSEMEILSFRVE